MNLFSNVICPMSTVRIDSSISRLTVFLNVILLFAYVTSGQPIIIAVVALDYGIRAAWQPQYSPMRFLAIQIGDAVNLPEKLTDQAPKLFASRIGFLFSFGSLLLFPLSVTASMVVASVLLLFATLDSVCNFCVGCLTYTYLVLPFYQRAGIRPKI